ncbi:hypothetical protein ACFV0C_37855 [Streptomyces sp. NPDC059568]|uniref:hypothetical protein n=1 Tax=Streptomyces sp. NPDC059568 TaxID=3346868 RepID=UPI0036A600AC
MTLKDPSETPCPGPGCRNTFTPKAGSGRPRLYCSDACGARYRKAHPRIDNIADVAGAASAADGLARSVALLQEASALGDAGRALHLYLECEKAMKEAGKAVVALCRSSKMKTSEIAASLHVSTDTVNRMAATAGHRDRATTPTPAIPAPATLTQPPAVRYDRPTAPAPPTAAPRNDPPPSSPAPCPTSSAAAPSPTRHSPSTPGSTPPTSPASSVANAPPGR